MSSRSNLRILMLTADYPPTGWSGIGVAVKNLAHGLARLGVKVQVLTRNCACMKTDGEPEVHHLDRTRFPIDISGADWIHLHSLSLSELAFELRRRTGVPVAYTAHSLLVLELKQTSAEARLWSLFQIEVMRASDVVVFLSESERSAGVMLVPEIASRSRVAGNGLPLPPVSARLRVINAPIIFAGRFAVSKGVALLERMLPMLNKVRPGAFVLAGGHGDSESIQAICNLRSNLGSSLKVPGWLPHYTLQALLATSALVLVPSYYEPFGMIALEAMRMGAPVLAARVGGLQETVKPGSGGCLVESHDPEEWCDAALRILEDCQFSRRLEESGPPYVAEQFSCLKAAERLVAQVYTSSPTPNRLAS